MEKNYLYSLCNFIFTYTFCCKNNKACFSSFFNQILFVKINTLKKTLRTVRSVFFSECEIVCTCRWAVKVQKLIRSSSGLLLYNIL